MANLTVKAIIKNSNMNEKLVRAVIKQSGGIEPFNEMYKDINKHGIMGGFNGWIYYSETSQFYRKNRKLIVELVNDTVCECDYDSSVSFVENFRCLDNSWSQDEIGKALYGRYDDELDLVYNSLAWFACETLCFELDGFEG